MEIFPEALRTKIFSSGEAVEVDGMLVLRDRSSPHSATILSHSTLEHSPFHVTTIIRGKLARVDFYAMEGETPRLRASYEYAPPRNGIHQTTATSFDSDGKPTDTQHMNITEASLFSIYKFDKIFRAAGVPFWVARSGPQGGSGLPDH